MGVGVRHELMLDCDGELCIPRGEGYSYGESTYIDSADVEGKWTYRKAIEVAKKRGWTFYKNNNKCLCPVCSKLKV